MEWDNFRFIGMTAYRGINIWFIGIKGWTFGFIGMKGYRGINPWLIGYKNAVG